MSAIKPGSKVQGALHAVAQSCTLLYRRIVFGSPYDTLRVMLMERLPGRLKTCDTAGFNSALRSGRGSLLRPTDLSTSLLLALCFLLPLISNADDTTSGDKLRIVLVGDSTVTDGGGWGAGFKLHVTDDAECINTARGGRSSKSFTDEGHWTNALALRGDYYLIQFGHNDQPGKGPERETDPDTTYSDNMARYVDDVRAIGGTPILVTSLVRRDFTNSDPRRIESTLTPYVEAMKSVAARKEVPLIDLHELSWRLCEQLGPEGCPALGPLKEDGTVDTTHLNAEGRQVFGGLVVQALRAEVPELASMLLAPPEPAMNGDRESSGAVDEAAATSFK